MQMDPLSPIKITKLLNDYKIYFLFNKNIEKNLFRDSAIKQIIGIGFIDKMQKNLDVKCENNQEYETFKKDFYIQNNINESIILKLKNNLNFNEEKFEAYVVFPSFCRAKISQKLLSINDNTDQRKKIDEIYSDVFKNPDKFIEYSEKYYDKKISPIKKLSFLSKSDLPQNLSDMIDNMKIGDISPVIQSISGYHIYRVESIVIDKEQNQNFYEINQIFVPTKSLNDYINDYLVNGKFKVLVP